MNRTDHATDPSYRLGLRLAEVHRLWRAELDTRLRPLGLSMARWVALVNLAAYPDGLTQNALALRVGIKGPTLVKQLDQLEADGWVERRDDPVDRRVKKVVVTEKAKPALKSITAVGHQLRHELLEGIDAEEIAIATAMLERMKARLQMMAESERTELAGAA
jgi:MarR family transcriptional regulator, transcriptional regulator for hemolysin